MNVEATRGSHALAAWVGEGPAFPHNWYHQVWILKTDGTAGAPLTEIPPGPIPVVDMGYFDGWQVPSQTYATARRPG